MPEHPRKSILRNVELPSTSIAAKSNNSLVAKRNELNILPLIENRNDQDSQMESMVPTNASLAMQSKTFDILEKFMASQKQISSQMNKQLMQLSNENQQVKSSLIEKSLTIKHLQQVLTKRNQEVQQLKKNCCDINHTNDQTMESFNSFREKFCHLEVIYDRQTEEFKAELDKYKKNLEEQKRNEMSKVKEMNITCNELKQMLAQKTEVYLLLDEKYCEMLKDLERLHTTLKKKDEEILEIKKDFVISSKEVENNLQDKIKQISKELEQKKVDYDKLAMDKLQMEEQKNKIINEQLYKIREIERVFVQPTKCVEAINTRQSLNVPPLQTELKSGAIVQPGSSLLTEVRNQDHLDASTSNVGTKRTMGVSANTRAGKRARKEKANKNSNIDKKSNKNSGEERINTNYDPGINTYLNSSLNTKKSDKINNMYTILSSSSEDSSEEFSYILSHPLRLNSFVPDTSDTSDNFTRLKNSN